MHCVREDLYHIEFERSENISICEAKYRASEACISIKQVKTMEQNKDLLREEALEFAVLVSDICDEVKGCSVFVNQLLRSSSSIVPIFTKQNMRRAGRILYTNLKLH